MNMSKRFDSIVIIPIAVVVGLGLGVTLTTGQFPAGMVSQVAGMMVGVWIGLFVLEMVFQMMTSAINDALYFEPEEEPSVGAPGELTILLLRDGEVVSEVKSWDKPIDKGRREFWAKKLVKLWKSKLAGAEIK